MAEHGLDARQRRLLQETRERLKLTKVELGRRAGCSHAMIVYIETGGRGVSFELLKKICAVLGLNCSLTIRRKRVRR